MGPEPASEEVGEHGQGSDVELEHFVDEVDFPFDEGGGVTEPCIIDGVGDVVGHCFELLEELIDGVSVAEVTWEANWFEFVLGTDFFGEGGEFFGAAGDEDGGDVTLGELEGDGFADALGGAGDDGVGWIGIVRS